ncbi:Teneurin-3, partial [Durusdinium trenchii]
MADEKDANAGAWTRVPTWDGSPQTWRSFRKEMSWWLAGLDIQSAKKYNLAARWLLKQSGVVRQRGEEFDPRDLEYGKEIKMPNAETGDDEVVMEEDPLSGINKLLTALEEMTGRSSLDKGGELRNVFYLELKHKSGERISEFATRYRGLVAELKAEGVTIHDGELGWWFKQKLGLDPLRTQLLETALAGAEDYPTIEREVLRLFKDLHAADPLYRRSGDADQKTPLLSRFLNQQSGASRASSYAPSMTSSAARSMRSGSSTASSGRMTPSTSFRRPFQKQAMVSEVEEEIPATAEAYEVDGDDEEAEQPSLEEEIEESVEAAAEAFLTMKVAMKQVSLKKQSDKRPCFDCGLPGHWAGILSDLKPGQQLGRKKKVAPKQVKVAEALNTEHEEITTPEHEVMMLRHESPVLTDAFLSTVQQFHEPKEVNALGLALDKRLVGALDSACNRTCTGADWLKGYLRRLKSS